MAADSRRQTQDCVTRLRETVGARTDTRPQRIKKDNEAIDKLQACFNESMNPLTDGGGKLRNIKTGLEVSEQVEKYMIHIRSNGSQARNCFVSECINDHNRFEAPRKKVKISNFASDTLEKSSSKTASQVAAGSRDLFGRLLYLSVENKIDVEKVFAYPLTPCPLSICHLDGSLLKTDKSKLFRMIESTITSIKPPYVDISVIDGGMLLQNLQTLPPNLPSTYRGLARSILVKACATPQNRIDLLFDSYKIPNLKTFQRRERQFYQSNFDFRSTAKETFRFLQSSKV